MIFVLFFLFQNHAVQIIVASWKVVKSDHLIALCCFLFQDCLNILGPILSKCNFGVSFYISTKKKNSGYYESD